MSMGLDENNESQSDSGSHSKLQADVTQKLFDWLQKVHQGDKSAMAEFMKLSQLRFANLGHGHARQMRGKEETPDLVQESQILLYNKILDQQFTDKNHLDAFLKTILNHAQINRHRYFFRAAKRNLLREVPGIDSVEDTHASPPGLNLENAEELEQLAKSLNILNETEMGILRSRHYDEMTWDDIGRKYGMSADAARKSHGRILGLVRSAMGLKVKVDWVGRT